MVDRISLRLALTRVSRPDSQWPVCRVQTRSDQCVAPKLAVTGVSRPNSQWPVCRAQTRSDRCVAPILAVTSVSRPDSQWPVCRLGQVLGSIWRNMTTVVQRLYFLAALLIAQSQLAVSDPYVCSTPGRLYSDIVTLYSTLDPKRWVFYLLYLPTHPMVLHGPYHRHIH